MINVLISVNSDYLDTAELMLHSLRKYNGEDVTVYLINRSLNCAEIKSFKKYLQEKLRMDFVVIDVESTAFDLLPMRIMRFSIEVYYRVIAQFLLPEKLDRVLWLDADIIICGSIRDFYFQNFDGALLAACPDVNCEDSDILQIKDSLGLPEKHTYFNSGVLLLNLEALRNTTSQQEIVETAQSIAPKTLYPDQDLLNFLYSGRVKYCDLKKFNCQVQSFGELTQEQIKDIAILHYSGDKKPWHCYDIYELSEAAIPYWNAVASQGKWFSIVKMAVLYGFWLVYYKTGVCNIVRKVMFKGK